ncbi:MULTISPECIES: hypothetical protein [unclassified Streptomyces]|uniref:hypothetical protein n=1 Tax=unclassified Streptomyces TaxID=2593676 RepID=UPI00332911B8
MSRPRRRGRISVVVLAGWLFADLLLVLALVSMADRPDPLADRPRAKDGTKPSPSASPTPTGPRSVELQPEEFRVKGTDKGDLTAQIHKNTGKWADREAALVLTFGGSRNGEAYAHRVNSLLGKGRPGMFTKKTATDDFHNLGDPASTAKVRVYFYTTPGG